MLRCGIGFQLGRRGGDRCAGAFGLCVEASGPADITAKTVTYSYIRPEPSAVEKGDMCHECAEGSGIDALKTKTVEKTQRLHLS